MGGQQSSQSDILPELQTMSMIKEDEFYSIYESKDDKQVEFWMFTSDESTYKTELQIIKDIQQQNFKGLTKILKYKVVEKEKLLIFTNKCICILTEHPKYSLQEFIKRYGNLDSKKIIELTISIVGAQKILGSKQQYIGMDNIFTNDGETFMIKPFLQTSSFYQTLQSKKIPLQDDDLLGFPAPEEFNLKVVDKGRVQIFSLGLILLQLILKKKSTDIYKNGKINFQMLDERTTELQETNNILYTKRFKEIIVSMIDTNLERRPNYNQLVDLLKNSDLAPQSKLPLNQVTVISDLSGAKDYFKKESVIGHRAIQIFESYSKYEKSILTQIEQQESRFYQKQSSIMKIQQLDGTKYQGELKNNDFHGEGKLFSKEDELIYQGEFYQGKYHGFGIQNFTKFQKIQGQYDFKNLKDMFLYVTKFQGQFQSGIKQGIGKAFLSNGETYCGDFVNDLPDGYGTFVNINKNIITAEWRKGEMKEKIGVLTSQINPQLINDNQDQQNKLSVSQKPALQQFTGISKLESILSVFYQSSKQHQDFFLSQQMKQNSIKFENLGETIVCYEGEIVNQKMSGKGVLYFKNKKVQYEGQFQKGLYHGYGKLYNQYPLKENKIDISDMRDIFTKGWWISFEGDFQNGQKHGFGQLLLSDQSQFYGEFFDDQVHGEGRWRRDGKQDFQAIWECNIIKSIISGQQ